MKYKKYIADLYTVIFLNLMQRKHKRVD